MKTKYIIRQNPQKNWPNAFITEGWKKTSFILSILLIILFSLPTSSNHVLGQSKATCTWTGSSSTSFGWFLNWADWNVPSSGDNIVFSASASRNCVLDANRTVGSITNTTSRNLSTNNRNLTINGTISFTGSGKIDATNTSGAVTFAGSSAQSLPSSNFLSNTITNLYIANNSGVSMSGDLIVSKKLTLTNGSFSIASNTLTLSDSLKPVSGTLVGGTSSNLVISGTGLSVTIPAITLNNLTLNRPNGLSLGGNMSVYGAMTLTSGTFTVGANTLSYYGTNPTVTAGLIDATNTLSKVIFLNTTPITFPVGLFRFYIYSLVMNGSGGVVLSENLTISKNLELINGKIQTNTNNLSMGNTTNNIVGGNSNSYINGYCKKTGNTAFTFHIGNSDVYAPISISAANGGGSASDAFTAKYHGTSPHPTYDSTQHESSIARISSMEYWTLDRTGGTNNVSVTLSWDDRSGGVSNLTDLLVARWDGSKWVNHGNTGTTGDTSSGTITSSIVSSFSPFTLASKNGFSNMLPITLLDFSVKCIDNKPQIEWATASEINNNYFEIQKSDDAVNWKTIEIIPGAGNSTIVNKYNYIDKISKGSKSFYRLKSVDFDGSCYFSNLQFVEDCENSDVGFKLFPNPSKGMILLDFSGNEEKIGKLEIYNLMGEIVYSYYGFVNEIDLSNQPEGTYYMIATHDGKRMIEKISIIK
jgi:hypothetical protein